MKQGVFCAVLLLNSDMARSKEDFGYAFLPLLTPLIGRHLAIVICAVYIIQRTHGALKQIALYSLGAFFQVPAIEVPGHCVKNVLLIMEKS